MKQRVGTAVFVLAMLFAISAYAADPESRELVAGEDYVPGEVLVKVSKAAHQALSTEAQVKMLIEGITPGVEDVKPVFSVTAGDEIASRHGLDRWYRVTYSAATDIQALLLNLNANLAVEYAERNLIGHVAWIPNDHYFFFTASQCQWALHNDDGLCFGFIGALADVDIDAPEAWDINAGDSTIKIGVLDTGVQYDHEDLSSKILSGGYDHYYGDDDPSDDHGHGTYMTGIMAAATNNAVGIAGVCPGCMVLPEQVCSSTGVCNVAAVAAGIYHADSSGVRILSMSLAFEDPSATLGDAVNTASDHGVVMVAAAGNDGTDNPDYPAGYSNVLGVAATSFNDERQPSSNYGSWVAVAAPGDGNYTTNLSGGYTTVGQTSTATAFVSGEAGLILSKCPTLTKAEVESIIMANVELYNSPEYIGTGRINLWYALRSFCEDGTICPGLYECLPGGICKLPCDSIGDCSSLGPTYECRDGYCEDLAGVPVAEGKGRIASLVAAPDPFVSSATIKFDLGRSGQVSLRVYDVTGRVVRTLASGGFGDGPHSVDWNALDDNGDRVSSGIYFCRLEAGGTTQTRKMILAR